MTITHASPLQSASLVRIAAGLLVVSGFVHAQLYVRGYRAISFVGPAFLLQASGSFAVAALILFGGPVFLRWLAAGLAIGALAGFTLSRTVGIAGFVERGWQPAPQALISVLAEVAALIILAALLVKGALWGK